MVWAHPAQLRLAAAVSRLISTSTGLRISQRCRSRLIRAALPLGLRQFVQSGEFRFQGQAPTPPPLAFHPLEIRLTLHQGQPLDVPHLALEPPVLPTGGRR
ncbi:hypothetical protein AS148_06255 [Achromobacter xylosoxidans]|nr:hypothetical protein AS148_06255 [Achromobacter xylosoxidans]